MVVIWDEIKMHFVALALQNDAPVAVQGTQNTAEQGVVAQHEQVRLRSEYKICKAQPEPCCCMLKDSGLQP